MIITTTRILFPPSVAKAGGVEYKLPDGEVIHATRADDLLEELQDADIIPSSAWFGHLITELRVGPLHTAPVSRLAAPVYHLAPNQNKLSFIAVSLTEFVHTEYDEDFNPMDLSHPLAELLRRVDYIAEQPGGKELLKMERAAYIESMKENDIEDVFAYEEKISKAQRAKRDEVLAYIAAL